RLCTRRLGILNLRWIRSQTLAKNPGPPRKREATIETTARPPTNRSANRPGVRRGVGNGQVTRPLVPATRFPGMPAAESQATPGPRGADHRQTTEVGPEVLTSSSRPALAAA